MDGKKVDGKKSRRVYTLKYGPTCSNPHCNEPHFARGFCKMHYARLIRGRGDPMAPGRRLSPGGSVQVSARLTPEVADAVIGRAAEMGIPTYQLVRIIIEDWFKSASRR